MQGGGSLALIASILLWIFGTGVWATVGMWATIGLLITVVFGLVFIAVLMLFVNKAWHF